MGLSWCIPSINLSVGCGQADSILNWNWNETLKRRWWYCRGWGGRPNQAFPPLSLSGHLLHVCTLITKWFSLERQVIEIFCQRKNNFNVAGPVFERNEICLGLPSKSRTASDTLDLLKVFIWVLNNSHFLNVCVFRFWGTNGNYSNWQVLDFVFSMIFS